MPNVRAWCFTLNNPKKHGGRTLVGNLQARCTYIIIGREYCPTTGTPHYQGYCVFRDPVSLRQLKELNQWVSWHRRKGSHEQARDYCAEDDKNPFIYDNNHQGERSDLNAVTEMIMKGSSLVDIVLAHPTTFIRNHNGIQKVIDILRAPGPRSAKPIVHWYWGPTHSGKSHAAEQLSPQSFHMVDNVNDMTGYNGQDVLIFEDFREVDMPFHKVLRVLDRYPMRMNKKFGSVQVNSKYIVFTTPKHPTMTFHNIDDEDINQLLRRIDVIREFEKFENFKNVYPDSSDNTQNENPRSRSSSQVP